MRFAQCTILALALGLVPCGCDWGGKEPAPAQAPPPAQAAGESAPSELPAARPPTGLYYPNDPAVYTRGVAIESNNPFTTGGPVASFRVTPPLPPGLVLDQVTGTISGTPTAVVPATVFQVTAVNAAGSFNGSLSITVNDQAPSERPEVALARFFTTREPAQTATVKDMGPGAKYEWTLTGGTLDSGQGTPSITFTPGEPGPLAVEVRVSNTGGSITSRGEATIVPIPDATLVLPTSARGRDAALVANVPAQEGMSFTWTILPGSATAAITSGQGTNQIAIAVGTGTGTFQVEVQVRNQAGKVYTSRGTIKVQ